AISVLLTFCGSLAAQPAASAAQHGIAADHIERSVRPGDDFYRYANGAWLQKTEIPPDRTSVGAFSLLDDLGNKRTAALIETMVKANAAAGSNERKVADLYQSYMDTATIEKRGLEPLKPQLDAIAAIKDKRELARALG